VAGDGDGDAGEVAAPVAPPPPAGDPSPDAMSVAGDGDGGGDAGEVAAPVAPIPPAGDPSPDATSVAERPKRKRQNLGARGWKRMV
jgi:hypothetical protein